MLADVRDKIFHFTLNVLLVVGKLQGFVVFTYRTVPELSYNNSPFLSAYSSVYTALIVISLYVLAIKIVMGYRLYQSISKSIVVFVYIAEQTITISRMVAVYVVQFYYRNDFRKLLSEALHLHRSIRELTNGHLVFDRTFYGCYIIKVTGILFQLVCILFLISLYRRIVIAVFHSHVVYFVLYIYTHFTAITISGFFYAGMMFILVLYQNLNRKLYQLSKSLTVVQDSTATNCESKHQPYRRLGDELDRIVVLYERVSTFTTNFNKIFSLQLLLTLFNAFSVILVEVRLYNIGKWKLLNENCFHIN